MTKNIPTGTNNNQEADSEKDYSDNVNQQNSEVTAHMNLQISEVTELVERVDSQLGIYAGIGDLAKKHIKKEVQDLISAYGAEDSATLVRNISIGELSLEETTQLLGQIGIIVSAEHVEDYIKNTLGYYYPRLSTSVRPIYFEKPTGEPICLMVQSMFVEHHVLNVQETPDGVIFVTDQHGGISYFAVSDSDKAESPQYKVNRMAFFGGINSELSSMKVVSQDCLYAINNTDGTICRWTLDPKTNQYVVIGLDVMGEFETDYGTVSAGSAIEWSDVRVQPNGDMYGDSANGLYKLTPNEFGEYVENMLQGTEFRSILQVLPDGSLYIKCSKDGNNYMAKYNPKTNEWTEYPMPEMELHTDSYLDCLGNMYYACDENEDEQCKIAIVSTDDRKDKSIVLTGLLCDTGSPIQVTSDKSIYYLLDRNLVRSKFINGNYSQPEIIFSPSVHNRLANVTAFQVCNGHIVCGTSYGGVYIIK